MAYNKNAIIIFVTDFSWNILTPHQCIAELQTFQYSIDASSLNSISSNKLSIHDYLFHDSIIIYILYIQCGNISLNVKLFLEFCFSLKHKKKTQKGANESKIGCQFRTKII